MPGYHVTNRPYWYNTSQSGVTPKYDSDLKVFAGIDSLSSALSSTFSVPGSEYYYKGTDRLNDLTNTSYKPNSNYAYGNCYVTSSTYNALLNSEAVVCENFNYSNLNDDRYTLFNRYGVSVGNISYVPVSVLVARSESIYRNYYMEIEIYPSNWTSSGSRGSWVDCTIYVNFRIEDSQTLTNTVTHLQTFSSAAVYETYTPTYLPVPLFAFYYNPDPVSPRLVYWIGVGSYRSTTTFDWHNLPLTTGSVITNNSHTFYQLRPTPGVSGADTIYQIWESDAYLQLNPNNTVAYDQLVSDIGPFGPDSEPDGYPTEPRDGHYDDSSDTIAIPEDPLIGVTNVGFVNVYKTGISSLQDIGVELFPDLQYTNPQPISGSTDVVDSIQNGFNAIITALANIPSIISQQVAATLINYIIDCHVLPVTPTGGSPENIKVGYKTLTATGDRLSTDYVPFDCGTIQLGEYYSSFADFMTSAKLFLPFVGFVPARPEWFYADTLGVKYKFNVIDGSFVAYVTSTGKYVNNGGSSGTVIAQYSGNACVHLPITGVTYASMVSGLVGAGAGAVASAGSGNIGGVASSVVNAAGASGDIPQSNAYASSGAFLSVRRPYLMIERPVTNYSPTFRKERGLPSNISRKLSSMSGFTILQDVHLDGITATDAEKKELESLLSKGVIF